VLKELRLFKIHHATRVFTNIHFNRLTKQLGISIRCISGRRRLVAGHSSREALFITSMAGCLLTHHIFVVLIVGVQVQVKYGCYVAECLVSVVLSLLTFMSHIHKTF